MASAVATVALLTGCSTENDIENGKDGLASLELSSVSSSDILTRAVIDGEDFPTDKGNIGLFLFANAAASQTYGDGYANVDYSYNSQKGKWTASPSIKVGSTPGYLYGYYPYNSSKTNVKAIPVTSSVNGDDVMYASQQDPITDQTAANTSIKMNHALARVCITVVNKGYTGEAKLQSIKFAGAEIAESGTLNAVDGTITATKAQAVTLTVPEASQAIATGDGTTYECLLVPSAVKEDKQEVTLTLTIDGEPKTATLSGNDNGVIIAQGTKSNITITLSNKGISVQTVSVEDWKVVEVGGHKVTIAVAEDVDPNDILTKAYVDGNNVIILASSFQGRGLICNVGDNAKCERIITNCKFTFTISEISSNIEAVLGYAPPVTLMVTSDSNGKVWIGNDKSKTSGQFEIGQQVVIHATPNDKFRFFIWNDNNRETSRTITLGEADVTYSASFISSDLIPGLFTVNSDGKQVFFSRGNLYWNGSEYCFEDNQYTVHTKSSAETENHIAHFYWSKSSDVARSLSNYSDAGTSSDVFFANNPEFKVNEHTGWSVLTSGEWKYLLDTRNQDNKFAKAKIHNMNGLLIFPDGYSLPSGYRSDGGTGMSKSNDKKAGFPSENISDETWFGMDAAGVVFLPAAGYRDGSSGNADVNNVGDSGYYWSASPYDNDDDIAFDLLFNSSLVNPLSLDFRDQAYSVRLVTEVK